ICAARAELAAKLKVTVTPGCAASNWWPMRANASVSDAAAKTVMDPDTDDDERPAALAAGPAALEQPASPPTSPAQARPTRASGTAERRIGPPRGPGRGCGQELAGISTDTLVAFTAATASTPGSRPSSSAASRLSSETNRWGPAWISTWAITG